jgi:hypothetical protein
MSQKLVEEEIEEVAIGDLVCSCVGREEDGRR